VEQSNPSSFWRAAIDRAAEIQDDGAPLRHGAL